MNTDPEKRAIAAHCRQIVSQHSDAMQYLVDEIIYETSLGKINGDTAFEVAREYIRRDAMKEGAKLLLTKINSYAAYER